MLIQPHFSWKFWADSNFTKKLYNYWIELYVKAHLWRQFTILALSEKIII